MNDETLIACIICSSYLTNLERSEVDQYVECLEKSGVYEVNYPYRDGTSTTDIIKELMSCSEIHVFWTEESPDLNSDMVAAMLAMSVRRLINKDQWPRVHVINNQKLRRSNDPSITNLLRLLSDGQDRGELDHEQQQHESP